jgi:hypothetical protein
LLVLQESAESMSERKKLKSKRRKFKTISFKLSHRQALSLANYSKLNNTSPIKVLKNRIQDCLNDYANHKTEKTKSAKNQLELFNDLPTEEQQLELFA